jgi:hypothetical protein
VLYPLFDALGSRNLIEGRIKSAVQGRVFGVTPGAGTPFVFRLMVCRSVATPTSVLQTVSALSFLMVCLLLRKLRLLTVDPGCHSRVTRATHGSHPLTVGQVAPFVWICRYASALGALAAMSTWVGSAARNGSSDPAAALCCNPQPQLKLTPASGHGV